MKTSEILPYLKRVKHQNIVQFLHVHDTELEMWIIMELCSTNLESFVSREILLSRDHIILIFMQCANALAYLHSPDMNIIHRDVKPNNILLKFISQSPMVKLTDFSFAKDIRLHPDSYMRTVRGNVFWMAPEMLTDFGVQCEVAEYKKPVDMFCLGLVFIFCLLKKESLNRFKQEPCM